MTTSLPRRIWGKLREAWCAAITWPRSIQTIIATYLLIEAIYMITKPEDHPVFEIGYVTPTMFGFVFGIVAMLSLVTGSKPADSAMAAAFMGRATILCAWWVTGEAPALPDTRWLLDFILALILLTTFGHKVKRAR